MASAEMEEVCGRGRARLARAIAISNQRDAHLHHGEVLLIMPRLSKYWHAGGYAGARSWRRK